MKKNSVTWLESRGWSRGFFPRLVLGITLLSSTTACTGAQVDKLEKLGQEPLLQEMSVADRGQPMTWPAPRTQQPPVATANSLWNPASKTFFRDLRATNTGDILTVRVKIKDKATLDNKTQQKRKASDNLGAGKLFGLEDKLVGFLPGKADPASLLEVDGSMDNSGEGQIERQEVIETQVAAVVTQVLPNGNMVIYGSQEIRVNHEVRQLTVEGVIRPGDIDPNNSISSEQVAEARISYGGRGLISDVQQPRLGSQVIDILSPF